MSTTYEPNARTVPDGYAVMGPPLARVATKSYSNFDGRRYFPIGHHPGGLTYHEAAAVCRWHYRASRI